MAKLTSICWEYYSYISRRPYRSPDVNDTPLNSPLVPLHLFWLMAILPIPHHPPGEPPCL